MTDLCSTCGHDWSLHTPERRCNGGWLVESPPFDVRNGAEVMYGEFHGPPIPCRCDRLIPIRVPAERCERCGRPADGEVKVGDDWAWLCSSCARRSVVDPGQQTLLG